MSTLAIVGGGYSGTLLAVNYLERGGGPVTLIERAPAFARGAAYATNRPEHLLNVRAANMSAFPDRPDHFVHWLGTDDGAEFAPRRDYARYLGHILDGFRKDARLRLVRGEAIAAEPVGAGWRVTLDDGSNVEAAALALALGNMAPAGPPGIDPASLPEGMLVSDPWRGDFVSSLKPGDGVLIIGTGLTMVDSVLTLDAKGFRGPILALSRRGLHPRTHSEWSQLREMVAPPEGGCAAVTATMRERVRARPRWQVAIDEVRPHVQALWLNADEAERRRFLRHLQPWWDVHRHRIAPQIARRIADLEAAGQLTIAGGRILGADAERANATIRWRPRGSDDVRHFRAARIINCTGPSRDFRRAVGPFASALLDNGHARADTLGLGLDVDDRCRVLGASGAPTPGLYAVGPLTKGRWWEIVAVPHIRHQVASLGARLALGA